MEQKSKFKSIKDLAIEMNLVHSFNIRSQEFLKQCQVSATYDFQKLQSRPTTVVINAPIDAFGIIILRIILIDLI